MSHSLTWQFFFGNLQSVLIGFRGLLSSWRQSCLHWRYFGLWAKGPKFELPLGFEVFFSCWVGARFTLAFFWPLDPKLTSSKQVFYPFLRIPVLIFWRCICFESLLPIRGLVTNDPCPLGQEKGTCSHCQIFGLNPQICHLLLGIPILIFWVACSCWDCNEVAVLLLAEWTWITCPLGRKRPWDLFTLAFFWPWSNRPRIFHAQICYLFLWIPFLILWRGIIFSIL